MGTTFNSLCNSCTNIGCKFQSGIVRTKCAFYMPPHIEPNSCGNYVVIQQPTVEAIPLSVIDKIRAEIDRIEINGQVDEHTMFVRSAEQVKQMVLEIIDKYKTERGSENDNL